MAHLPPASGLPQLSEGDQTKVLDLLFEPSPGIHSTLLPVVRKAEYSSYTELIDACHRTFFALADKASAESPNPVLLSIVGSHPRLGAKKVDSAQSVAEQANLQDQGEQLASLNQEYEEKFPGLRFVVFVNGRGRPEIMNDMRTRIDRGDFSKEIDAALQVSNTHKKPEAY